MIGLPLGTLAPGAVFVAADVFQTVQLGQEQLFEFLAPPKHHGHADHVLETHIASSLQVGHRIDSDAGASGHVGLPRLKSNI
ncbi:hypothetical protein WJ36_27000 [Burkholderia ubonensis]|nr:hypothetical protein WJ36_27000 [Burkholderia ubonensis]KWK64853.1 hypothetical protein WM15_11170 [Burkholderia ubonensis]